MHVRTVAIAFGALIACQHAEQRRAPQQQSAAAPSGIAAFARHAQFTSAKVSPKGTWVAALSQEGGRRTLQFIKLATHEVTFVLRPEGESTIGTFRWANDDRVVIEMVDQEGTLAAPVTRGEIAAVNANGTDGRLIFGYRISGSQTGTHIKKAEATQAWGFVIGALRDDPRHILIEQIAWSDVGDHVADIYKLDVYSGLKTRVAHSPIPDASFLTDETGALQIASGVDEHTNPKFFLFQGEAGWRELRSIRGFTSASQPVRFVARDRILYVTEPGRDGFALYEVSIDTGQRKLVAQNPSVPPSSIVDDSRTGRVVAVEYDPDLPTYEFVDAAHPLSKILQGLLAARPNEQVEILNTTADDRKALVRVYSDRDPGQFLLVDVATMTAEPVAQVRPWVNPEEMAETSAFHIAASDGMRIHGYVTLPPNRDGKTPPPLVVLPHGGPHGVRDYWAFDPEVQMLAHEGFAVLQVNYRGSGGYGRAYREAGYRQWGSRVVQDIVDATRFAVRKGFADPERICIYGASFGGYAAMQGAILAPDLFRCAVGYAGIYDLSLLSKIGDVAESRLGRGYVRTAVGEDPRALEQSSPVRRADELRARVLLIHGKKDVRAPLDHAEALRDALASRGRPPEWIVEPKEGHGFYDEGARERMYERLVRFLKENTRGPAAGRQGAANSGP